MHEKNKNFDPTDKNSRRFIPVGAQEFIRDVGSFASGGIAGVAANAIGRGVSDFARGTARDLNLLQNAPQANTQQSKQPIPELQVPQTDQFVAIPQQGPVQQQPQIQAPTPNVPAQPTQVSAQAPQTTTPQNTETFTTPSGAVVDREGNVLSAPEQPNNGFGQIRNNLGIPDLIDEVTQRPEKTTQQLYTELYQVAGIPDIRNDISRVDQEINKIRNQATRATAGEQNNAFLSQATRAGRIGRIQDLANQQIANLTDQRNSLVQEFDLGVGEIEQQIAGIASDFEQDRQITADRLNLLLEEAERQEAQFTAPSAEQFTLSKDQTRFDAQGNVIARGVSSSAGSGSGASGTVSVPNVSFRAGQKINLSDLPDLPGKLVTDKTAREFGFPLGMTTGQFNYAQENLPGNAAFQRLAIKGVKEYDNLAGLLELSSDIQEIRNLKNTVNTGSVSGRFQSLQGKVDLASSEFVQLKVKTGKQLAEFIKSISGAAVSEQEAQRLAQLIPNVNASDSEFDAQLEDFRDGHQAIVDSKISQYGFIDENDLRSAVMGDVATFLEGIPTAQ